MSGFSRECLFRHHSPFRTSNVLQLFVPLKTAQRSRLLSSTTILRAVKTSQKSISAKSSDRKVGPSSTPSTLPVYQTYAATLAQKSSPTLLYEAPSHTAFMACCYTGAIFSFSIAAGSVVHYIAPVQVGMPEYVPMAFGVSAIFMSTLGTYLLTGTARIIKTVTAIPKYLVPGRSPVAANTAKPTNPELQIEVELRKMFPLPFFPARKLILNPKDITLQNYISPPLPAKMTSQEMQAVRIEEEKTRKEYLEYERSHIMSGPFRHFNRAVWSLLKNSARSWDRDGFLKVQIKKKEYKLDVHGGWALDRGRALERLAVVKASS